MNIIVLGERELLSELVSGIIHLMLLVSMLTLAFNIQLVEASGSIYIRADGNVEGTTWIVSDDNVSYSFIANINDSIVIERSDIIIDGNGYTLNGSGSILYGFRLTSVSNVTIKNVNIAEFYGCGVSLELAIQNVISCNNITANINGGIHLYSSSNNNNISRNNITNTGFNGIWVGYSSNNIIQENNIAGNLNGTNIDCSSNNTLVGNNITNNRIGIILNNSSNYALFGNNLISNNRIGIALYASSNNNIYHNNLISNTYNVHDYWWDFPWNSASINVWDDGYPSGGNYWSDYNDTDLCSGPYQNETGSDGIGDTPYTIDVNNQDRYPFISLHNIGIISVTNSKTGCLPMPTIGQGLSLSINITVFNYGINTETFNITVYANTTVIGTLTNVTLASRSSTTITFIWNTSGFARAYVISVNATQVEGETDSSDNTLVDGVVKVSCIGDINGDYRTDMLDYQLVKNAIPSLPGSPKWNPNADMDNNLIINMLDYQIVKNHIPSILPP